MTVTNSKRSDGCDTRERKDPRRGGIRLPLVPLRIHVRSGSSRLFAPFCPLAFLLSPDESERRLGGAVGIEPKTLRLHIYPWITWRESRNSASGHLRVRTYRRG